MNSENAGSLPHRQNGSTRRQVISLNSASSTLRGGPCPREIGIGLPSFTAGGPPRAREREILPVPVHIGELLPGNDNVRHARGSRPPSYGTGRHARRRHWRDPGAIADGDLAEDLRPRPDEDVVAQ